MCGRERTAFEVIPILRVLLRRRRARAGVVALLDVTPPEYAEVHTSSVVTFTRAGSDMMCCLEADREGGCAVW